MIKTYGERGDSYLGRRVKHEMLTNHQGIISSKNIPCEAEFILENVDLKFDGPEENYRPWMEFSGYVKRLIGEFPCHIEEINFSEKKRFDTRFRYDFSNEELAELAKKGLFSREYAERGLNEPDVFFKGNQLEFPVLVDVNIIEANNGPQHAVFVDINSRHYIEIDANSSGYTEGFAQHYADLEVIKQKEAEENDELFIQSEEYIETIGDIELIDTIPENSYMLSLEEESDLFEYDMDIDKEQEMSLFEKYNIEQDVEKRSEKYQHDIKERAKEYQAQQEAKAIEVAMRQENDTNEEAVFLAETTEKETSDRFFDIDLSELDEDIRKKQKALKRKAYVAEEQQKEIQKIDISMESMGVDQEEKVIDTNEFDFI